MGFLRVTLHDWDFKTNEPKELITVEMQYEDDMTLEEQGGKKITIAAGNDVACGTTSFPLAMLMACMSQVMQADAKRSQPGIIMPDNSIIRPN